MEERDLMGGVRRRAEKCLEMERSVKEWGGIGGVRRKAEECGVVEWAGEECGGGRRSGRAGMDGEAP